MTAGWGPRAGGPQIAQPPTESRSRGWTVSGVVALALVGMLLVGTGQKPGDGLGLLLLIIAGIWGLSAVVGPMVSTGVVRRRQESDARRWRDELPETRIAASADPLADAQRFTAARGGTVYLGVTPDFREWTTAEREQAVLVLGPPRSGKTSALIVPSLLVAPGPALSTSTKPDVLHATAAARSRHGRVWLFDPSGSESVPDGAVELHWSPVHSARTWDGARLIADAMVDAAATDDGVQNGRYWSESAKALLAPCLFAAAVGGRTISDVRRWISRMDLGEPRRILKSHGAVTASDDLAAIESTEEKERSSIFATARIVLAAYGSDAAAARSAAQNFDAAAFVRSRDTVYVTAPSHLQNVLAPLVVGLLEEIRIETYRHARECSAAGISPTPVFWALDEIANIAPLKKLPSIVSEAGGQGLQIMACFQDLSQATVRWNKAAEGFLTLFGTKIVFPGIGDRRTLEALSTMVGDWDRPYTCFNASTGTSTQFGFPMGFTVGQNSGAGQQFSARRERLLTPAEISTIPPGHVLMVRSGRWGLLESTPYHHATPWLRVIDSIPPYIRLGVPDEIPTIVPPEQQRSAPRRRTPWLTPSGDP